MPGIRNENDPHGWLPPIEEILADLARRDGDPPRGPFTVAGEAELRERFRGMDRETAQRLVDEADHAGYAPGAPETLGRFVAEVRDVMTGALETAAVCKITRQDDGSYLVTETARDERET